MKATEATAQIFTFFFKLNKTGSAFQVLGGKVQVCIHTHAHTHTLKGRLV